jgi:hypothetical protein
VSSSSSSISINKQHPDDNRIVSTMNTAAEFYEWLMQIEQDPSVPSCEVEFAEDDSQPSLACTVSSSSTDSNGSCCEENSSLDTSLHSSSANSHDKLLLQQQQEEAPTKRRVSFAKNVQVREHAVTVGDHPFCFDGLPLTLDWEHAEDAVEYDIEISRERLQRYRMPPRLSYEERRERLFTVSDYNDNQVRNEEINMVINLLQQSWSQNYILPMPDLSAIIDDDETDDPDAANAHYEEVMEWKRNMSRHISPQTSL